MQSHKLFYYNNHKKPTIYRIKEHTSHENMNKIVNTDVGKKTNITFNSNIAKSELDIDGHFDFKGNVHIKHTLGEGKFATTFRARYQNVDVAIKHSKFSYYKPKNNMVIESFLQEEAIYKIIDESRKANPRQHSSGITYAFGSCTYNYKNFERMMLVIELVPNGDLENWLDKGNKLTWNQAYRVIRDVAVGVRFLHRLKIVHGDVKPANILLDENLRAKLTDFGLSKVEDNEIDAQGTPLFADPQQLIGCVPRDRKLDIWALGLLMYSLFEAKEPYENIDTEAKLYQTVVVDKKINIIPDLNHRTWVADIEFFRALHNLQTLISKYGFREYAEDQIPALTTEQELEITEANKKIELAKVKQKRSRQQTEKAIILSTWCCQYQRADRPTATQLLEELKKNLMYLYRAR